MVLRSKKLLWCLMLLLGFLIVLTTGAVIAWGRTGGPQNPYSGSLSLQGWSIFELQVPTIIDSSQSSDSLLSPSPNSLDYYNDWYAVAVWGTSPSDGRTALYNDDVYNDSMGYVNSLDLAYLNAINNDFISEEPGYQFFNPNVNGGTWELYNLYQGNDIAPSSGFLLNHKTWFYAAGQLGNGSKTTVPNNDVQALTASDNDGSNLFVKYYYDHNNGQTGYGLGNPGDWLFNPAPGTPDYGNGVAPGGFAQLTIYPPDIQIKLDAGNAGQPVAPGTQVQGSWVALNGGSNGSLMSWAGVKVNIYMTDSTGTKLLQQVASYGGQNPTTEGNSATGIDLPAGGSQSGTFTWTMPSGQPNGVEIWASVDEDLSFGASGASTSHDDIYMNSGAGWTGTNEDYDWSNNMAPPVPVAVPQSDNGGPALTVTPSSATVNVGGTQQFRDLYWPNGTGGASQDVTTASSWSSGNTGIATVVASGANGGVSTGVSPGTTGISATYDGLTASGQLTVTQVAGYNLKAISVDTGADSGAQPGNTYSATAKFSSTFPTSGLVTIDFYYSDTLGTKKFLGSQQMTMPANGTLTSNPQSWQFPSGGSGTTTVTITASIDYYANGNGTTPDTVLQFNGQWESDASHTTNGDPSPGSDPDNITQASVSYESNSGPSVQGQWASGYAVVPIQTTQQQTVTVPYQVTPMGKQVPIIPGPTQTWGPPHYYLSY